MTRTLTTPLPDRPDARSQIERRRLAEQNVTLRWFACYTRSRHEKRVDALLQERGFEVFLPLIQRERQWHDRKKVVRWPLFPSYVFARFTRDGLFRVLSTPGVAAIVSFDGDPVPIADEEIDNVKRFAAALVETGFEPEPIHFVGEGQRVRIVSGPFRGIEGMVVERRGRRRALVQVGLRVIQQGLKLEIDVASLKAIDGDRRGRVVEHPRGPRC